jgi:hypothetical protein
LTGGDILVIKHHSKKVLTMPPKTENKCLKSMICLQL